MERTPVQSSNLASVGYDEATATLEVEFQGSGVYQYFGVAAFVFEGLMSAGSKGSYFDQHVRRAGYPYHRVG
ncbi:MAG: KTSC domain-containing protein [Deltaproteobacteria bacterium]|nr:KTSC domain-containing protein [Deltaproteobacteria bacterium]